MIQVVLISELIKCYPLFPRGCAPIGTKLTYRIGLVQFKLCDRRITQEDTAYVCLQQFMNIRKCPKQISTEQSVLTLSPRASPRLRSAFWSQKTLPNHYIDQSGSQVDDFEDLFPIDGFFDPVKGKDHLFGLRRIDGG